jgi:hypothetical protein
VGTDPEGNEMARKDNFDLPIVERDCPKCGSRFQVVRGWTDGPAKEPPPCSVCGEPFLEHNMREREELGKSSTQNDPIEYLMIKLISRSQPPEPPTEV